MKERRTSGLFNLASPALNGKGYRRGARDRLDAQLPAPLGGAVFHFLSCHPLCPFQDVQDESLAFGVFCVAVFALRRLGDRLGCFIYRNRAR